LSVLGVRAGRLSRTSLRNGAYSDYLYDRGRRLTRPANYHTAYSVGAAPTGDILFTGKDLDPGTGLCYFTARL
jgi:hypothetical protein